MGKGGWCLWRRKGAREEREVEREGEEKEGEKRYGVGRSIEGCKEDIIGKERGLRGYLWERSKESTYEGSSVWVWEGSEGKR